MSHITSNTILRSNGGNLEGQGHRVDLLRPVCVYLKNDATMKQQVHIRDTVRLSS